MKTVEVIVEHAGKNLSAYIVGAPVITVATKVKWCKCEWEFISKCK